MTATYTTSSLKPTTIRPVDCLNPRRRRFLEIVLEFLRYHGGRFTFDAISYEEVQDEIELLRHEVQVALDDAYTFGLVDLNYSNRGAEIVVLLSTDIDAAIEATLKTTNVRHLRGRA